MHALVVLVLLIVGLALAAGLGLWMSTPGLDFAPTIGTALLGGVGVVVAGFAIVILLVLLMVLTSLFR